MEVLNNFDVWFRDYTGMHSPAKFTEPHGEGLMLGIGKGFAGALDNTEKQYLKPAVEALRARLEKLLNDPHIQAMLALIKKSEVGNDKNPYGRAFGHGGHVDPNTLKADGSNWRGERVYSPTLHRSVMTHAFGAYQAEPGTYRDFSRKTGVTDVSPHSQDLFAVHDIMSKYPRALQMILKATRRARCRRSRKNGKASRLIRQAKEHHSLVVSIRSSQAARP
jgi:muramidase (phage lysozyme)